MAVNQQSEIIPGSRRKKYYFGGIFFIFGSEKAMYEKGDEGSSIAMPVIALC